MLEFRLHGCSTPVLGIKMARTGQFSELTPTRVCWEALHPRAWQAPGFVLPGMPAEKLPVCASQARTCSHVRCQKKSPLQQPAAGGDASLIHLPHAVFPWGFISLLHPSHFEAARVEGLLRALPSSQLPSVPVWCYSMTHGTSILPQAEKILSFYLGMTPLSPFGPRISTCPGGSLHTHAARRGMHMGRHTAASFPCCSLSSTKTDDIKLITLITCNCFLLVHLRRRKEKRLPRASHHK